jgi:hypothetical protein
MTEFFSFSLIFAPFLAQRFLRPAALVLSPRALAVKQARGFSGAFQSCLCVLILSVTMFFSFTERENQNK